MSGPPDRYPSTCRGGRLAARPAPPAEERALPELSAAAVALAVLRDVGRARAGGVKPGTTVPSGPLHLPVDGAPQAAEREARVHGLAQRQVERAPRPCVLRREPVGVLAELRVLAAPPRRRCSGRASPRGCPRGCPAPCSISATVSQPSMNGTSGNSGYSMCALSTIRYAALPGCSSTNPEVREW